jgi:hypothetical protein
MTDGKRIMTGENVTFRLYRSEDIDEILRIQKDNLWSRLSDTERLNGFLSVAFPAEQFEEMQEGIPMVVADMGGGRLGGYLCGSSLAYSAKVPLLAHMIALFGGTLYKGRPLDQYRSFIYGPICVDRPLRGDGILEGLYEEFLRQLSGRFEVGALFVSLNNPRSLAAHMDKLGMVKLCEFTFDNRVFALLVFDVPLGEDS